MKNWATLEPDVVKLMNKHYSPGRAGHKITHVVIHHNAGILSINQIWQVWQTREASAHYQVESGGRIGQLVWDRDTAWHAASQTINRQSIGIEISNNTGSPGWGISETAIEEAAHLTAAILVYYKLGSPASGRNIRWHREFASTSCPHHLAPGGKYNQHFMNRVRFWYASMTGNPTPVTTVPAKPKEQAVFHPMRGEKYTVSSKYGQRSGGHHNGTDFAAAHGTPIYAPADGVVVQGRDRAQGSVQGFGSWIWIDSQSAVGKDFIFGHVHHPGIKVRRGDKVTAGQMIGVVGNEGQSTGPHLHFEVWGPPGREGGRHENSDSWLSKNVNNGKTGGLTMSEAAEINRRLDQIQKDLRTMSDQLIGWKREHGKPVFHGFPQGADLTLYNLTSAIAEAVGVEGTRDIRNKKAA